MFMIHKKNINLGSKLNPVYLYGYGGFNVSLQPAFNPFRIVLMQAFNFIVAIPNIRGGGEYGEEWHKAGILKNKQNSFDDFCLAAQFLVDQNFTTFKKIAISGASNGGLLIGACINQHPELFGAAIAQVGVLDMLKYHKFTIGHAWKGDYGDPDNEEMLEVIKKYSPVHNVRGDIGEYPAVLLTTADHDDRVWPGHSFKFCATLQEVVGGRDGGQRQPLLIKVEKKSGHGAGKPTEKAIEDTADIYAFIAWALDLGQVIQ
eukprot:TRINITY_DN4884_c0_g1_i1.p1 TRINITY_DN4884_c0_g1~~TRINITY_DN4884_c0_g1_i1.p1  ORF type:complete len:260 (+),score=57.21 TRINITY_DN4884_c0_g1_i1:524-1303(+)